MVTLEIDGIRVEAETVAKATRLAKAEKARQERARTVSYERAYAQIGHLASSPHATGFKLTDGQFANRIRIDGERTTVKAELAGEADAEFTFYGYDVSAIWCRPNGTTLMIDTTERDSNRVVVFAVGVSDGVVAMVELPEIVRSAILAAH